MLLPPVLKLLKLSCCYFVSGYTLDLFVHWTENINTHNIGNTSIYDELVLSGKIATVRHVLFKGSNVTSTYFLITFSTCTLLTLFTSVQPAIYPCHCQVFSPSLHPPVPVFNIECPSTCLLSYKVVVTGCNLVSIIRPFKARS